MDDRRALSCGKPRSAACAGCFGTKRSQVSMPRPTNSIRTWRHRPGRCRCWTDGVTTGQPRLDPLPGPPRPQRCHGVLNPWLGRSHQQQREATPLTTLTAFLNGSGVSGDSRAPGLPESACWMIYALPPRRGSPGASTAGPRGTRGEGARVSILASRVGLLRSRAGRSRGSGEGRLYHKLCMHCTLTDSDHGEVRGGDLSAHRLHLCARAPVAGWAACVQRHHPLGTRIARQDPVADDSIQHSSQHTERLGDLRPRNAVVDHRRHPLVDLARRDPANPRRTEHGGKLLEAKDCFVRAAL